MRWPTYNAEHLAADKLRLKTTPRFSVLEVLEAQGFTVETDPEQKTDAAPGEVVLWRLTAECPECHRFFVEYVQGDKFICKCDDTRRTLAPVVYERVKVKVAL